MGYETKIIVCVKNEYISQEYQFIEHRTWDKFVQVYDDEFGKFYYSDHEKAYLAESEYKHIKKRGYGMKVAELDMCKIGNSTIFDVARETTHYYYSDDGNTPIILDRYDDPLCEMPIDVCIKAFEKDMENSDYRRFKAAVGMLKSLREAFKGTDLIVLTFGH